MTTTKPSLGVNHWIIKRALTHLKGLKAWYAEYAEEVDDWYRNGPGRPRRMRTRTETIDGEFHVWQENVGGEGHTYPTCIHGRDLWVDHDIPCGQCEGGRGVYELALDHAHADWNEYMRRINVWHAALDAKAPQSITEPIFRWAAEIIDLNHA